METFESVDDIVAMAGAVLSGLANPDNKPAPYFTYNDKAGWLPFFKGHNANPVEIPGLAVAYNPGPTTPENPNG